MLSQSPISGAAISGYSAALDTNPPTTVGVLTSSNIAQTSFTLSWQAFTDENSVAGYEVSVDGGATYTDVGNVLTFNKTGLTASTSYSTRLRAYDTFANRSVPLSLTVTTKDVDITVPVMVGSLNGGTPSSTSFTVTWQAATDNTAVTGYKVSKDGGATYTDVGNVLTYTFTGLTSSTQYPVRVLAYDAGNNNSAPLSLSVTTAVYGAVLSQTARSANVLQPASVVLGAMPTVITYVRRSQQLLVIYNKTASNVVVNVAGSSATSVFILGTGGGSFSVAGGLNVTAVPGYTMLQLDNAHSFLVGTVSITAATESAVAACLLG